MTCKAVLEPRSHVRRGRHAVAALLAPAALGGCSTVTISDGASVQRLTMPPGINIVIVRVEHAIPLAIESHTLGLTISRSGAHLGALQETVALLPNDGSCRVVLMKPPADTSGPTLASRMCLSKGERE
jgi:hypothetical protein